MRTKFVFALLCLLSINFFGQEPNEEKSDEDLIIDALFDEEKILDEIIASFSNFQMLYASVTFNNNSYFSGRDIGIDQYNLKPQLMYANSKGFFTSVSSTYFQNLDPNWDVSTATVGFFKNFGKSNNLSLSSSYTSYFFANEEDATFENDLNLSLGIATKNKKLGTYIGGSYLFGEDQSIQLTAKSYASILLVQKADLSLKLKPNVIVIAGKETVEYFRIVIINGLPRIQRYENEVFDFINTQVSIPLQLTIDAFDFELGFVTNFPSEIGNEPDLKTTNFISFGVGYLIPLKSKQKLNENYFDLN